MTLLSSERSAERQPASGSPTDDGSAYGWQTPPIQIAPPSVSSAGQEAIDLAARAGLHLDPWQQHVLRVGMGEKPDGSWSAFEVAVNVPRQNGKGALIEARELWGLFIGGEDLILHSAHEFKDLDVTTPILTANRGWSTMGELRDGDEVYGPDGQPTKVLAAHPVLTTSHCYRVTFADGQSFVAGSGHLWQVSEVSRSGAVQQRVVTTEAMRTAGLVHTWKREGGRDRNVYRWRVELSEPFDSPRADLPIDPYLLGAWLGDGDVSGGRLTVGAQDLPDFLAVLDALGEKYHVAPDKRTDGRVYCVGVYGLRARLRDVGVLGDKRIPDVYAMASIEQRRALLAGVLDTDGTVSAHQVAVTMVNRNLMEDVASLVRSLGYRATLREFRASLNGQDAGAMHRVQFSAGSSEPFRLARKNAAIKRLKSGRSRYNAVVGIELVPTRPTRCITVAHESGCFVVGRGFTVTHNTAKAAFKRIERLIRQTPDLHKRVRTYRQTVGEEGIELHSGQVLRFIARSKGSGRGFTGHCNILDEDMILGDNEMDALLPTMAAVEDPQIWYLGSAGIGALSVQLARLRKRALAAIEVGAPDPSLAYFEWSANLHVKECPKGCTAHDDPASDEAVMKANPAVGYRLTLEKVAKERATLSPEGYARERLGVGEYPSDEGDAWAVIGKDVWEALADGDSQMDDPVALAVDVTPERSHASICAAGRNGEFVHVEVVDNRPGTDWVPGRLRELAERHGPRCVVIDPGSPAGALITEVVEKLKVDPDAEVDEDEEPRLLMPVVQTKTRDVVQATGQFYDAVVSGRVRHLDQAPLATALAGARKRDLGEAWAWARRGVGVDITPLVGVTQARWGVFVEIEEPEEEVEPWAEFG
ncbi:MULTISPECIES: LAGLIDADG family homing endonuclease [unclassified Streptomyces]|uniref:LAGLIDADG family homing endonuclease n=1 Tax=unclassified Streptomyces TaxID=2593676 RepID=UPI0019D2A4AC|nr:MULTISPECIES: LAGLIDADG family homing endonuclease [unclassified Streptomyces]